MGDGGSWTGDVDDADDEGGGDDNPEPQQDFAHEMEIAIRGDGSPDDISEIDLINKVDEVEDEELLREAWLQLEGERQNIVENRIEDLTGEVPGNEDTSENDTKTENSDENEPTEESGGDGWGGSSSDEEEDEDESEDEDSSDGSQPAVESVEEMDDGEAEEEPEATENAPSSVSEQSDGPPVPPSAVGPDELAQRERRWKIMVWGPSKLFKTHFAYTMPEPIAFVDTEGKADDLVKKFQGKEIQFWRPKEMTAQPDTRFRRVRKAVEEALEWLNWYWENEGRRGTIVIDSVSDLWEWAQRHHKIENYPLKDPEDVELSANFKSSQESDWGVVKEYHNGEIRDHITDSPFHFYWSARERVAFNETFEDEDNRQILEPRGEPNNDYHVDTIIQARNDTEQGKVGDLVGSNFTDNNFVGLRKPTFPKVRDAIEAISDAEASPDPVDRSDLAQEIDARAIINHDPQRYRQ